MTIEQAYFYSVMIGSLGIFVMSVETLLRLYVFSESGILSWKISKLTTKWLVEGFYARFIHALLCDRAFKGVLWLELTSSFGLLIFSSMKIIVPWLILIELLCLILFSFRTLYGLDGAHHMNLVVVGALCVAGFCGLSSKAALFCMWFVSAQLMLSYFIAGIKKLFSPTWRTGEALIFIFRTDAYGHPLIYRLVANSVAIRNIATWSVIGFETCFPLIIFGNASCLWIFLGIGFCFHLMNALFMGLNNFLPAFVSAYPILLYSMLSTQLPVLFLPFLFYSIFPMLMIAWLWQQKQSLWQVWLKGGIMSIYIANLWFVGLSPMFGLGYYGIYVLLACFIISWVRARYKARKDRFERKMSKAAIVGYTLLGLIAGLMCVEIGAARKGAVLPGGALELAFPLKNGNYYVAHGGNHSIINHHQSVAGQKFALDLIQLNRWGWRSSSLLPSELSEYTIFGREIYSPAEGIILKAIDTFNDLPPSQMDSGHPAGNHIIIQIEGTDKAVVLAHLLQGSLCVKEGERVSKGQLLAKVGNSGNTSEPHLHMHCVVLNERGDFLYEAESVPMVFNKKFLIRNRLFREL